MKIINGRKINDTHIVRVDTIEEAKHVVSKMKKMGYKFIPHNVVKCNCYYIAIDVEIIDTGEKKKTISWGRDEVEKSPNFEKWIPYEDFVNN